MRLHSPEARRPVLRPGSSGEAVRQLQQLLNSSLTPDGIFGSRTEAEVRHFQQANGLEADGVVGPETWAMLERRSREAYRAGKPPTEVTAA